MSASYSEFRDQLRAAVDRSRHDDIDLRRYGSELSYGRYRGPAPSSARQASVILLLHPAEDGWAVPLILRPGHMSVHGGQISLPGGAVEPDENSETAALRELEEELGVPPRTVDIVGGLSPIYIFASDHLVTPWLATVADRPHWRPSPAEVDELFHFSLNDLMRDRCVQTTPRTVRGVTFQSPAFHRGPHVIWGATCLMLGELVEILAAARPAIAENLTKPQ